MTAHAPVTGLRREVQADGLTLRRDMAAAVPLSGAAASRRLQLSFSSEQPVLRELGGETVWEVLSHRDGDVDLSRLDTGRVPLLVDHRAALDSQIGRVERAWIEAGRGRAEILFNDTGPAREMLARVRDGDVGNVSVAYEVLGWTIDGEREGVPVARVRWRPYELSLVAVPADPTVGIGRSAGTTPGASRRRHAMPQDDHTPAAEPATATRSAPTRAVQDAINAERHRVAEVRALAEHLELPDSLVQRGLSGELTLDAFKSAALAHMAEQDAGPTLASPAYHRRNPQPYSLTRAIAAVESGNWQAAAFERECAEELRAVRGANAQGAYVPLAALSGKRDLLTTANAGSLIGTDHMADAFIDTLRPAVKVVQMGATVMPGLRGNVSVPKMTAGATAEWIAEDGEAAESTPTFAPVQLTLRQLSARARMSRRQVKQADPSLEQVLRRDLLEQIGSALDKAAIAGAGTATVPEGILELASLATIESNTVADAGGFLTMPLLMGLVGTVEAQDVQGGSMGFLSNPRVKGQLLGNPMFPNGSAPLMTPMTDGSGDGLIGGFRAMFTSNVPSNLTKGTATGLSALIFGKFSDLLVGSWGGVDVLVDEYTEAAKGNVAIVAHSEWDVAVRYAESFAAIKDIDTTYDVTPAT